MSTNRNARTTAYSRAFGEAVRQFRKRTRIAQDRFAIQAGIDRAFFSGIERGVRNPTLLTIWRIAKALGTTPSKLIRAAEKLVNEDTGEPKGHQRSGVTRRTDGS